MADEAEVKKEMDDSEIYSVLDEIDESDVDGLTFVENDNQFIVEPRTEPEIHNQTDIEEKDVGKTNTSDTSGVNDDLPNKSNASDTNGTVEDCTNNEDIQEEEDIEEEQETHPYLYLIESFEIPKEQMSLTTVGKCKTLEETPLHLIYTRGVLVKLLQTLKSAKEIAIDLQYQSSEYATNINLVMISTKDADYIIDVTKLKSEMLLLTEVFINPKILKIVNRADKVLSMLQQKLHLYLVNIFDVEKAGLALCGGTHWGIFTTMKQDYSFEREKCNFTTVRTRPLTLQVKNFCRAAPHYLIYIYHDYKNKLLLKDAELYKKILTECRDACKRLHHTKSELKELLEEFEKRQKCGVEVLTKLHNWRNSTAKKMDKTIDSVLNKAAMMQIASQLPVDEKILVEMGHSQFYKKDIEIIGKIVEEARTKYNIPYKKKRQRFHDKKQTETQTNKRKPNEWTPHKQNQQQRFHNKKMKLDHQFQQSRSNQYFNQNVGQSSTPQPLMKRPLNMPNTGFNNSKSVLLTPSNVPSNTVFQQANGDYMNLINEINRRDRDQLMQRSLPNLKMANEEMQNNVGFGNNRYNRYLSDVDHTIDMLEKRIGRIQEKASRQETRSNKNRHFSN